LPTIDCRLAIFATKRVIMITPEELDEGAEKTVNHPPPGH
jgi:hypothetical protein